MARRATKGDVRESLRILHDTGVAPMKEALLADDGEKVVEALEALEDAAEALRELIEDRYDEFFVEEEVAVTTPGGVEVIEGVVVPGEEEEEEEAEDD